jgi:hypothetical protein
MSITVSGLNELYAKLDRVAALDILEPPMQRGVLRLEAYMKHYPSPPPQSTYRRTGTLGRRWVTAPIARTGNTLIGKIGNNLGYAPYVQSRMLQARIHQGRWRTDQDAVRDNETAIVADFERTIAHAVKE